MLRKLGDHIANALERAAAAERRAHEVTDPELRLDNEQMAQSWRLLARGFLFVESLEQFLIGAQATEQRNLQPPESSGEASL